MRFALQAIRSACPSRTEEAALVRAPEGHVVTLKADVETLKGQLADAEARCA
jgi:hypothetical protein